MRDVDQGGDPGSSPSLMSRRAFVKATSASAVVLVGLGGAGALTASAGLLRPPGGQDEASLIAQCNRCGRCVSVCHTRAIGTATLSDGIASVRTPVMRFNLGSCDFCGDCAKVCPTQALRPFDVDAARAGNVEAAKIGVAVIDPDTCLGWVSDSCNLCYAKCPYQAIELDVRKHPVVLEDRCNGCGVCENVCPVLSFRSYIGGTMRAVRVETEVRS